MKAMKKAIYLTVMLALISGLILLYLAFRNIDIKFILYFIIGLGSIAAALKYTMGKNPYGYKGLGDIFVFVFFGLVSVIGTYFLLTSNFSWQIILPAISIGCWSTAVLNLNNLRDIDNDKVAGKITIPVRIGKTNGLVYQYFLISMPFVCNILYAVLSSNFILACILFSSIAIAFLFFQELFKNPDHKMLDLLLKKTALFSLLFTLLFVFGVLIG
jgi:1,4-dihydroxy-2-naphthoate octaprenyltransferase